MGRYIIRRILIFIPTLFVITLFSFIISLNAPGDPVQKLLTGGSESGASADRSITENQYLQKRAQLGLDLPVFYFSLSALSQSDTLHRVARPHEREMLSTLTHEFGNWPLIQDYFRGLNKLEQDAYSLLADSSNRQLINEIQLTVSDLKRATTEPEIVSYLNRIDSLTRTRPALLLTVREDANKARGLFFTVRDNPTRWKNYVPALHWHGTQSQYHRWLSNLLSGDLGTSYADRKPVITVLKEALPWSLMMNIVSILLAYGISVPLGVFSVRNRNTGRDRTVSVVLFILYSLPGFWVATLMINFLCNPEYLQWFPASSATSVDYNEAWTFWQKFSDISWHLFLPTLCYTYTTFAFLSRQMRAGMMDVISQDYIRTARAKGLSERTVIWKHAFRNSLIPLITHFANIFPAMVGGSVIIETIFSIPGMGRETYLASYDQNHPMIIAVFTLGAIMTLLGILVSDILYALVDPRISFTRK